MKRLEKVLFLCTGNSCRSQMAEGFLRYMAGDRFDVHSAGTRPTAINPNAIEVMREKGIDISQQRSKDVSEYAGQPFAYVVTVCDNAKQQCPVFPAKATRIHWSLPDPAEANGSEGERLRAFRDVRDEIERQVRTLSGGL